MKKIRLLLVVALSLLIALLFSLQQTHPGRAGNRENGRQQPRVGETTGLVAETKAVTPSVDTTVRTENPNSNYATAALGIGVNGSNRINTVLYFPVENGVVPYQSVVNSAVLKLSLIGGTQVATTISARAIITDWAGLADKSKWETAVTWLSKSPVTSTIAGQATIAPGNNLAITITDLYAGWLNAPGNYPNFGIELQGSSAASAYEYLFNSREDSATPVIEVNYTPQPTNITIPQISGTVTIDNNCSEYPASSYKYVDIGQRYSSVYVAHDGEYLYFCAENAATNYATRFYALYIDTDLGREAQAEKDDLAFYTNPITKKSDNEWGNSIDKYTPIPCLIVPPPESCDGNTAVKLKNWEAMSGSTSATVEVAEYKIKLDLIGVNCRERKVGMSFYHHLFYDIEDDFGWPTDRWFDEPQTWIEASFAQLPASLPETCAAVTPFPTVTPSLFMPLITR